MTIYLSFDIETTGPVPGLYSMLSVGCVAHRDTDWKELGHFSVNLLEEGTAAWYPDTEEWWMASEQADAYLKTTKDQVLPSIAMGRFCAFLETLSGTHVEAKPIIFVAYPVVFDWGFVNYYMQKYCPERWHKLQFDRNVGFAAMDIQTLAASILDLPFHKATKKRWLTHWSSEEFPHTHVALEDARSQAYSFVQMMKDLKEKESRLMPAKPPCPGTGGHHDWQDSGRNTIVACKQCGEVQR